jgi:hypothetical protein
MLCFRTMVALFCSVFYSVDFHNFMHAENALGTTLLLTINNMCSLKSSCDPSLGVASTVRVADVSQIGTYTSSARL